MSNNTQIIDNTKGAPAADALKQEPTTQAPDTPANPAQTPAAEPAAAPAPEAPKAEPKNAAPAAAPAAPVDEVAAAEAAKAAEIAKAAGASEEAGIFSKIGDHLKENWAWYAGAAALIGVGIAAGIYYHNKQSGETTTTEA